MKKIMLGLALVAATVGIYSFAPQPGDTFTANTTTSKVEFIGSKTDGYHPGYFLLKSGQVTIEAGKLTGGKFTIDLASLKVTDAAGEKLEGHLKSPDFFDFSKGTEATYVISNVKYTSANKCDIDGILTLKGVTAPVKFTANVRGVDDKKFFAEAAFSLDRTAFGINYGVGKVSSDVQLLVHLFATK
ncbi:YceI family protein [Parasediminibacterium sp. JCM 36343]|uniref:YceI family protein n=1 Tax=Parasediminibacterium sp. JCM 36343 TaxID=3374279 RepID=UPI00397C6DD7